MSIFSKTLLKTFLIGFLFLSILLLLLSIKSQNSHSIIIGMNYHDARKIILNSGWIPAKGMPPYREIGAAAHYFRDLGYSDVEECSGSGVELCNFYFQNEAGEYLKIGTEAENNDRRIYPRVIYAAIKLEID
jgi:hypothetical protein